MGMSTESIGLCLINDAVSGIEIVAHYRTAWNEEKCDLEHA
jgi:hypothetical protein